MVFRTGLSRRPMTIQLGTQMKEASIRMTIQTLMPLTAVRRSTLPKIPEHRGMGTVHRSTAQRVSRRTLSHRVHLLSETEFK